MGIRHGSRMLALSTTRRAVLLGAAAPAFRLGPLAAAPATPAAGPEPCLPTPPMTAGPFWLPGMPVRRDITEGRPGLPLALELRVFSADGCRPLAGLAIDLWHCDAAGVYSGVQGDTGSWMRGIQVTGEDGAAVFDTVFPGWYPGRTPHLHLLVRAGGAAEGGSIIGGEPVFVGQLYFDDARTDLVYALPPYDTRDNAGRPRNEQDGIFMREPERDRLIVPVADAVGADGAAEATPAPGAATTGSFAIVTAA
ncbi:MAG: intradiol ring-cleavage dioxygenase [Chloroflexota bacterium]